MPEKHPVVATLTFEGQATETFARLLDSLHEYGVTITTIDGETIEAVLLGSAQNAEDEDGDSWYDAVFFGRVVEGEEYMGLSWYEDHDGIEYARVSNIKIT